jgi:hypothetical protein
VTDDNALECDLCPPGHVRTRAARRHPLGPHLDRSDAASAADGTVCARREPWVPTAETRRQPLAVWVENAKATWSQPMIATIATLEARKM